MQNKGIIGAVCGDIIGSAYEFHKTKDMNFKLFTPRSKFTDDTVMTCAVAEWLVEDPKHSHEQLVRIMHRYGDEYPHAGYGGMFRKWLENKWTEPYNSFGNGSAMRVSPCGYYAKSFEEALQLAQISAEVTHSHPEGIIGAQAVAAMIYLLRSGEYFEKGKAFLKNHCFYDIDKISENWETIQRDYDFDVTCQGSVPEAIYCAMKISPLLWDTKKQSGKPFHWVVMPIPKGLLQVVSQQQSVKFPTKSLMNVLTGLNLH
jgi:ADP-ribosylglycohydrolase